MFQYVFSTEGIILEIVQLTNFEVSFNRRNDKMPATFRDTNKYENRTLSRNLTLTAALKGNYLSTKELFNTLYCEMRYRATMCCK